MMEEHGSALVNFDHRDNCGEGTLWLEKAFRQYPGLTAAVVQDMSSARELFSSAEKRGLKVPSDFSIICACQSGYDLRRRSFTTVDRPDLAMGKAAGRAMLEGVREECGEEWFKPLFVLPEGIIDFGTTGPVKRKKR